nr:immunoglobulin heavy chain junction region [Macaca mulatta]
CATGGMAATGVDHW